MPESVAGAERQESAAGQVRKACIFASLCFLLSDRGLVISRRCFMKACHGLCQVHGRGRGHRGPIETWRKIKVQHDEQQDRESPRRKSSPPKTSLPVYLLEIFGAPL